MLHSIIVLSLKAGARNYGTVNTSTHSRMYYVLVRSLRSVPVCGVQYRYRTLHCVLLVVCVQTTGTAVPVPDVVAN
jgi:hypothetical protein